jgi:hypothetical protein
MDREAIELGVATVASKSTYAGAGTSFLGWLLSSEFTVIFGIVVALAGLGVNWYYKAKSDRRAEALFRARLDRIQAGTRSDTDLAGLGEDD